MCHEHIPHDWRSEEETTEEESDPSFLNEEADTEVELVTDGGDE
ncbi:MAG: hypothetical protein V5A55_13390 [Halovenus sp.]